MFNGLRYKESVNKQIEASFAGCTFNFRIETKHKTASCGSDEILGKQTNSSKLCFTRNKEHYICMIIITLTLH